MATNYGDVSYWDQRFSQRQEAFEWLKDCNGFIPYIKAAVDEVPQDERLILHIGSGSSSLSLSLRHLVLSPRQVHNIDFSTEAVQLGRKMEDASRHPAGQTGGLAEDSKMLWSQADLLDVHDIHKLLDKTLDNKLYNLIVDKSTSDSIACSSDVDYDPTMLTSSTTPLASSASHSDRNGDSKTKKTTPVRLLALHMAAITATHGCWLVLSYSDSRFPFVDKPNPFQSQPRTNPGDLDSADYWSLETKQELPRSEVSKNQGVGGHVVYRPATVNWLYLLRRNERPLRLTTLP